MAGFNPNELTDQEYWALAQQMEADARLADMAGSAAAPRAVSQMVSQGVPYQGDARARANSFALAQTAPQQSNAFPIQQMLYEAGYAPTQNAPAMSTQPTVQQGRGGYPGWIMMQSGPYATGAYYNGYPGTYTGTGEFAGRPPIGFASAYPHMLPSGYAGPGRMLGFVNSLLPQFGFLPFMGGGMMPPMPQPRASSGGRARSAKTASTAAAPSLTSSHAVPTVQTAPPLAASHTAIVPQGTSVSIESVPTNQPVPEPSLLQRIVNYYNSFDDTPDSADPYELFIDVIPTGDPAGSVTNLTPPAAPNAVNNPVPMAPSHLPPAMPVPSSSMVNQPLPGPAMPVVY